MNRLHQLKQTLMKNLEDTANYSNLEIVLLDYNSQDGMEEWVKTHLMRYIESKRLIYYRTTDPESWNPSHSKNLAFKLADGDIICGIWADYYTGKGFPEYVNNCFKTDSNCVLTPIDFPRTRKDYAAPGDVLGKVCVKKVDFLKVRGFDERMDKHGFEDYDFINRLEMIGLKRVLIDKSEFLKYLMHDDIQRFTLPTANLKGLYINYLTPSRSGVLLIYSNGFFEKGIVIDNSTSDADHPQYAYQSCTFDFEYSLENPGWTCGKWYESKNTFMLTNESGDDIILMRHGEDEVFFDTKSGASYYNQRNEQVIGELLRFHHFIYTRLIMEQNMKENTAVVNPQGYGVAKVIRNFEEILNT